MSYLNVQTGVDTSGKPIYSGGAGDAPPAYVAPAAAAPVTTPVVGHNGLPPGGGGDAQTNASGAVTGAAPAGSKQSSNGNYIDSAGNQYTQAPSSEPTAGSVYGADYSPSSINSAEAADANFAINGLDSNTQDSIRADTLKSFQAEIDATNSVYADKLAAAQVTGSNRLGSTTAVDARRGLIGSDFGNAAVDTTNAANNQVYSSIGDEKAAAIAAINTASNSAVTSALAAKTTAKQQGLDAYLKYLTDAAGRSTTSASTAATLLLNNKQDPTTLDSATLQKLLTSYGITSDQLTAAYNTAKTAATTAAATAQKAGETVLSPGQTVIGPDGKAIASLPPKDTYTVVQGKTTTDALGNQTVGPDRVFDSTTGEFVGTTNSAPASSANLPGSTTAPGSANIPGSKTTPDSSASTTPGTNKYGASFAQYGKLANTDLNPAASVDQLALKYLDSYIKNGTVPTYTSLGRGITPAGLAQIATRASDLYTQATGGGLPTPAIIKAQQGILANNYKLGNNLAIQSGTVTQNVDLSLANMTKNGLNSSGFKPLDDLIDGIKNTLQDPNVGQLILQNTTIQNEVGSLLAVKNASGTTVYDKLSSAGIIAKNDSPAVIQQKLTALIQEANNFSTSLQSANGTAYNFTDPLQQDQNNPARASGIVNSLLSAQNIDYKDLSSQMDAVQSQYPGTQKALDVSTGLPYFATPAEIASGKYVPL